MSCTESTVPVKCLKCQAELASPIVCTGCRTLYPPPQSADYFDLLGLQRNYVIDESQLTAAVRAISRKIHPDRFADQPPEMRKLATRLSAEVNQAMTVLKDPAQRAAYMLELAGGPSAAEVRDVPGDLLAEVMVLREQIDEAQSSQDAEPVEQMRSSIQARRTQALKQIASRADQLAAHSDEEKKEFRRLLNSLKYFDNLLEQLAADPLAQASGADNG